MACVISLIALSSSNLIIILSKHHKVGTCLKAKATWGLSATFFWTRLNLRWVEGMGKQGDNSWEEGSGLNQIWSGPLIKPKLASS